jgi:hypothetical protein
VPYAEKLETRSLKLRRNTSVPSAPHTVDMVRSYMLFNGEILINYV